MKKLLSTAMLAAALSLLIAAQANGGIITTGSDAVATPTPTPTSFSPEDGTASATGGGETTTLDGAALSLMLSVMNSLLALP